MTVMTEMTVMTVMTVILMHLLVVETPEAYHMHLPIDKVLEMAGCGEMA